MSLETVICGAFVVVACTLNLGFFIGELDNPQHHQLLQLAATVVVNLIAMTLKFGDRTHIGAVHLATSIVAVIQLLAALTKAGIEQACGLISGTGTDANNLAIVNAARRLKRKLFVVIRQNHAGNRSLIEAARADMAFVQSTLMTNESVQMLTTPLLSRLLLLARRQTNTWSVGVAGRLRDAIGETVPHTWTVTCDTDLLGMHCALVEQPEPPFTVAHLLTDPDDRRQRLGAVPLLLLAGRGRGDVSAPRTLEPRRP